MHQVLCRAIKCFAGSPCTKCFAVLEGHGPNRRMSSTASASVSCPSCELWPVPVARQLSLGQWRPSKRGPARQRTGSETKL
eukprot:9293623-Pyramimonas_sp.AAC.1